MNMVLARIPPNHPDSLMMQIVDVPSHGNPLLPVSGKRKLSDYRPSESSTRDMGAVDYNGCDVEDLLRRMEHVSSKALNTDHAARFYTSTLLQEPQQFLMPRLERSYWKQLSTAAKEQIGGCLQELLNRQTFKNIQSWIFVGLTHDLPVFQCPTTQMQFTLILGGNYRKGMSRSLQEQLYNCLLKHFRVSSLDQIPLQSTSQQQILQLLRYYEPIENASDITYHVSPFLLATIPISYHQAKLLFEDDRDYHFRLPSENEWEYAARGGGWEMLFPYSFQIDTVDVNHHPHLSSRNAVGLHQVGVRPELCTRVANSDGSTSWSEVPDNEPKQVVARGGADVWSLIYYARPAKLPHLSMTDDSDNNNVVRLALDIYPGHPERHFAF